MQTNLIITTYPKTKSANVGDLLITNSFIELARSIEVLDQYEVIFREVLLNDELLERYGRLPIFIPGMSISSTSYPKLYTLRDSLSEVPAGLIPFGCTWQHPIGFPENAETAGFSETMLLFLRGVVERTGPIAVRDHMAAGILTRHSIPSVTVGDCAWYHLPSRGRVMRRPQQVKKLIITTPHATDLVTQSLALIDMVCDLFSRAEILLSLHSKPTTHSAQIADYARQKGLGVIDAAGRPEIFDQYEECDLHIGYRLHGHISFISRRVPSVLLMEDARSRGFSCSMPVGCFAAKKAVVGADILARVPLSLARQHVVPDPAAVSRVREFLEQELSSKFLRYVGIPGYLDGMLEEVVIPQLEDKVLLATRAIACR